jgi:hypothetical protein
LTSRKGNLLDTKITVFYGTIESIVTICPSREEEGEGSDILNVPAVVSISAGALILITNRHSRTKSSCPPFRLLRLIRLFEVITSLSYSSRNVIFALSGSIYTVSARAKR